MIESIPYVLTGIGIIVSILYYTSVLRNANKTQQMQLETRQAQLYMQLHLRVTSPDFHKTANYVYTLPSETEADFQRLLEPNEDSAQFASMMRGFDSLGHMVKRGYIDVEMLDGIGGGFAYPRSWGKWENFILYARKSLGSDYLEGFEYLKDVIVEYRASKGLTI